METRKKVLVVGGSGYLGQHILEALSDKTHKQNQHLAFTHYSNLPQDLLDSIPNLLPFRIDLQTGLGFESISQHFGLPDVVVNCAAISIPRTCEMDPDAAMSINVPSSLVKWLLSFKGNIPLLIHLSTDQVYEGVKSFYNEEDETLPVNVYGKSKVAAEAFISANYSNFVILRSSIIFGPQTISPVPKSLPIQWIENILSKGEKVDFFHDEFRCPVYVKDVVTVILILINNSNFDGNQKLIFNVGGPDRLSRVQMAEAVALIKRCDASLINPVAAASSVSRGVVSPADISMDISKLVRTLQISPTPFIDGVRNTLAA